MGCFNIEVTVRSFGDSYIESKQYADRVREYMLHILRVFSRLLSTDKLRICTFTIAVFAAYALSDNAVDLVSV